MDLQPNLPAVPEQIAARLVACQHLFFDVDRTLVEHQGTIPASLVAAIHGCDKACGLATSRCLSEANEIMVGTGHEMRGLFSGPIIIEDGTLAILPGTEHPQLLISVDAHIPVMSLASALQRKLIAVPGEPAWKRFDGVDRPLVQMPPGYEASATIWEKGGPGSPDFAHAMALVESTADELGVRSRVHLLEIGDGTLRISVPGVSKGAALRQLHDEGIIDLAKVAYFGDGGNDIPAAQQVKEFGGVVVVVDHHCPELLALADHVTPAGDTGPQAITRILAPLVIPSSAGGGHWGLGSQIST